MKIERYLRALELQQLREEQEALMRADEEARQRREEYLARQEAKKKEAQERERLLAAQRKKEEDDARWLAQEQEREAQERQRRAAQEEADAEALEQLAAAQSHQHQHDNGDDHSQPSSSRIDVSSDYLLSPKILLEPLPSSVPRPSSHSGIPSSSILSSAPIPIHDSLIGSSSSSSNPPSIPNPQSSFRASPSSRRTAPAGSVGIASHNLSSLSSSKTGGGG